MRGPITSATLPGRTSRAKRHNLGPQKSMNFPVDVRLVCKRWIDGLGEVDQNSVPLRCIQVRGGGRGLLCKSAYVRATRYCQ